MSIYTNKKSFHTCRYLMVSQLYNADLLTSKLVTIPRETLSVSYSVSIPYKVLNIRFITL